MFISGIVAGIMGIHGWMDHKTTTASILNNTFNREEIKENRTSTSINVDMILVEKYAQKYKNDPSYAPLNWTENFN
jgi:hypothetical protein